MKNPIKTLAILNTVLLVGVIVFLVFAKTESGEKVKFSLKNADESDTTKA